MKKEFPGYFSGSTADVERMWDECIFVLDANVLLNLYRYSDFTCSKLLEVFRSLDDRLWVPHQVVYEYLNNRLPVIGEQSKVYEDAVKKVEVLRKGLESHNQHPFITPATLADSLQLFDRIVLELSENKLVYEKRINSDEIKEQLEFLLEGKVGGGFNREQLEKIIVDGKGRYEQKVPPGFCDTKKGGDSIVFADMCRPYGDYIVWLQIIEKAKEVDKSVVFVTGDTKDDWWSSFQGKTLGPHPQLVQEFLQMVGKNFYMYLPDRFLEKASEYLNQGGTEQAVNEIRDVRQEDLESELLNRVINLSSHGVHSSQDISWISRPGMEAWAGRSSKNIKSKWRRSESDFSKSLELQRLSEQRGYLGEKILQLRAQLDALLAERNSVVDQQAKLFSSGIDTHDERFNESRGHLSYINMKTESLEEDLSALSAQMHAVAIREHALLDDSSEG